MTRDLIATSAALGTLVFLAVPIVVVGNNIGDMSGIEVLPLLGVGLISAILATACIALVAKGLTLFLPSRWIKLLLFALLFFVVLTGFVLPLTGEAGQVEVAEIPTNVTNLLIALAGAVVLSGLTLTPARGAVLFGTGMISALLPAMGLWTILSTSGSKSDEIYRLSTGRNILVMGFDGIAGPIAEEVLRDDPEVASAFADFSFFPNAISSSPATTSSLTAIMAGDLDLKQEFGTEERLKAEMDPQRLITNRLSTSGYGVAAYGTYSTTLSEASSAAAYPNGALQSTGGSTQEILDVMDYALARTLSPKLVFANRIGSFLPTGNDDNDSIASKAAQHKGARWDSKYVLQKTDFELFLERLKVDGDQPAAKYMHLLHTHFPVDFDERCQYRSDDLEWHQANQNRVGAKNETRCAVSEMARVIRRLKDLGAYDRTTIVFASDHGQPPRYYSPNRMESFTIRNHPNWGMGRYMPFLAIKGEGRKGSALKFDERPVALADLARTVCVAAALDSCDTFKGYNLLDALPFPKDATYQINFVQGPRATFRLDGMETRRIPRTTKILNALNNLMLNETVTNTMACGKQVSLVAGKKYNNGRSDYKGWATWRDRQSMYLRIRRPACATSVVVEVRKADPSTKFLVNGNPASIARRGQTWVEIALPASIAVGMSVTVVAQAAKVPAPELASITLKR